MASDPTVIEVLGKRVIAVEDVNRVCECSAVRCAFIDVDCNVEADDLDLAAACSVHRLPDTSTMFVTEEDYPKYLSQRLLR